MTKSELLKLQDGTELTLDLLISDYSRSQTKTGSSYFTGTASCKGVVPFKVWSGACFDEMAETSYRGCVATCSAEVNIYNGQFSLIIRSIAKSDGNPMDFEESPYNPDALWEKFDGLVGSAMTKEGYSLAMEILNDRLELFKTGAAAKSFHDNFVGGLLAHTYKMCLVLGLSLRMYRGISESLDKDLLYMSVIMHDIGKTMEYKNGTLSEVSFAGHHAMGVDILAQYREKVVEVFGEAWYYRLLSVVTQHHGEFGEKPKSVEALLVHNIDLFESQMQLLNQTLPITEVTQVGQYRVS